MAYSITEQFVAWLETLGYDASTYPPDSGSEFVTVERTGGGVENLVDYPTMAVQTWAATEPRAEEMATAIRDAALLGSKPYGVASIRVNSGPYPFWDTYTRLPRYQILFDCAAYITDNE